MCSHIPVLRQILPYISQHVSRATPSWGTSSQQEGISPMDGKRVQLACSTKLCNTASGPMDILISKRLRGWRRSTNQNLYGSARPHTYANSRSKNLQLSQMVSVHIWRPIS